MSVGLTMRNEGKNAYCKYLNFTVDGSDGYPAAQLICIWKCSETNSSTVALAGIEVEKMNYIE